MEYLVIPWTSSYQDISQVVRRKERVQTIDMQTPSD